MLLRIFVISAIIWGLSGSSAAQSRRAATETEYVVENGDTIPLIRLRNIQVTHFARKRDMRAYARLARAVRLTYPIAKEARRRLGGMEARLLKLPTPKEQKAYIRQVEDSLKREYTPVLRKMSLYQGVVLLKLIDRETGKTSFRLVQELRGKFSAFFWQGIARIFGANLKTEYDREGDDVMIEYLVGLYEAGEL